MGWLELVFCWRIFIYMSYLCLQEAEEDDEEGEEDKTEDDATKEDDTTTEPKDEL